MISKPILFSGPMVRAIIEGRKTQTRRIVKPQPDNWIRPFPDEDCEPYWNIGGFRLRSDASNPLKCPHPVGSEMWVRETLDGVMGCDSTYCADDTRVVDSHPDKWDVWREGRSLPCRTVPSIHMPRWACRITLNVTDVRVQRLQDISRDDALAEGIERVGGDTSVCPWRNYRIGEPGEMKMHCSAPERSYMTLWESINGPGSWDANPWVWAYTFDVLRRTA